MRLAGSVEDRNRPVTVELDFEDPIRRIKGSFGAICHHRGNKFGEERFWHVEEAIAHVVDKNIMRRHLTNDQCADRGQALRATASAGAWRGWEIKFCFSALRIRKLFANSHAGLVIPPQWVCCFGER
jgi:hypothetical protein